MFYVYSIVVSFGSDISSKLSVVGSESPLDFQEGEAFFETPSATDYERGPSDIA